MTETLLNLKIHKLSNESYESKKDSLDSSAFYLTPDNTTAGSSTNPVYFEDGEPKPCNIQRVYSSMIPYGDKIPEKDNEIPTDLNTTKYLKVGNYYNNLSKEVINMKNCPTQQAFMMQVYSPLSTTIDNETKDTWVYRLRKITDYRGNEWYQEVSSGASAGIFSYGTWRMALKDTDLSISDAQDGQFLRWVSGQPKWETVPSAETSSF
jgi:hypothetical protein